MKGVKRMLTELTPEQEALLNERVKAKMDEVIPQIVDDIRAKLLRIMKNHFGEEAYRAVVQGNGEGVIKQWKKKAEQAGDNSIESLIKLLWEPLRAYGFEYTMEETKTGIQMNCTKCWSHDFAVRKKITEEMFYLACETDPFIVEGFNPNIGFTRTKSLMQGDDCCNHFYYYKNKPTT
jgi:predicted ArsR family transcriptional regulator